MKAKLLSTKKAAINIRCPVLNCLTLGLNAALYTAMRKLITQPDKMATHKEAELWMNWVSTAWDEPANTNAGRAIAALVLRPALTDATPHTNANGR